jgi:hypothetical protein
MRNRLCHQVVRVDVDGPPAAQTHRFGHDELRPDRIDDTIGDIILPREDIGNRAIVPVGPDVNALGRIDQLGGDSDVATRLPHAALEHVTCAQIGRQLPDVDRFAFEGKAGVTIDNREPLLA